MRTKPIIDISLPIVEGMITYPGDAKPRIVGPRRKRGSSTFHSILTLGSHTGTHIDAPRHVLKNGARVDTIAFDRLMGPCRVLDCTTARSNVTIQDLKPHRVQRGERILLKTRNSRRGFHRFPKSYVALDGDAAEYLGRTNVRLVGIDMLSVKQRGSRDQRPHTALLKRGIPIIEGLNLRNVRPGRYHLIALPLRLKGLDGAPSRVVLMPS